MSEDRRQRLEQRLAVETERLAGDAVSGDGHSRSGYRIRAVCTLVTERLAVSGTGATVLSDLADGDGDGRLPQRGLVYATNEVSSGLEDLQLTVGEGPCLDTFNTGGPVLIADLSETSARWPAFTPGAIELGAVAVFSFPLQIGVIRLGSLDVYHDTAGPLTEQQLSDALVLADLATQAVMAELEGHGSDDVSWLADPHAEVHQATGMVQVQLQTSSNAALLQLRGYAYSHELLLSEVARRVVARELNLALSYETD